MTFGNELQGSESHDALLRLHDAEIRLLENIRKCMNLRIDADKKYTLSLGQLITQAQKFENSEFNSPLFQAWNTVIKETETFINLIKANADELSTKTIEKLSLLINEKKASKKNYAEERLRLDRELNQGKADVENYHTEYGRLMEKLKVDRSRYEDMFGKEKQGRKLDDSKSKYLERTAKLHRTHNEYVMAINDIGIHQRDYRNLLLPGLLNHHQLIQEQLVQQSKDNLSEYSRLTNVTSTDFVRSHQDVEKSIRKISPASEYVEFLEKYKTDPASLEKLEFDGKLHDEYNGTLLKGEISVDDLTFEDMKHKQTDLKATQETTHADKEKKEASLKQCQTEIQEISGGSLNEIKKNEITVKRRAVQFLEKSISELSCREKRLSRQYKLIVGPLERHHDDPPKALDLDSGTGMSTAASSPTLSQQDTSASKFGFHNMKDKLTNRITKMKKNIQKPSKGPPKPPSKDFLGERQSQTSENDSEVDTNSINRDSYTEEKNDIATITVPENGSYIKMMLNPNQPLVDSNWFHGVLPRGEVERLLQNDGDYLVRESRNKKSGDVQYVLSVQWQGHKHFIIQGQEDSWRFEGASFRTIQELIINQHKSCQPVTNKSKAILKKPIFRECWQLQNDDIALGRNIGKGNFGEVYQGIYCGQQVAVKTCKLEMDDEQKRKFLQEGKILQQYDHPNIVKFIGIAAQRQPIMIVMEYVEGGALLNYLRKNSAILKNKQLIKMCEDAAAGMAYLENNHCIHRDLATRNCLVGKDTIIKISDFGMSREEEEYTVSDGLKQIPIKWTAPEALNFGKYTSLCDVWSYGILMWEIFAGGQTPYPGQSNQQARDKVDTGYRMPAPDSTPQKVYDVMLKCWEHEPDRRPHFDQIFRDLQRIRRAMPSDHYDA